MERLSRLTRRLGRVMTNTDPPDYTRLRKLVNWAFTARQVQGLASATGHTSVWPPLARLESEVAIGVLVRRLPALCLGTGTVERWPIPALRGPACLPVAY